MIKTFIIKYVTAAYETAGKYDYKVIAKENIMILLIVSWRCIDG